MIQSYILYFMPLLVLWSTTNIKTGCRNTLKAGSVPLLQCTQRGSLHILLYNYCDSYCDKQQFPSNTEKKCFFTLWVFFWNKGVQNDRYQGSDRVQHAQIIFLFLSQIYPRLVAQLKVNTASISFCWKRVQCFFSSSRLFGKHKPL